MRRRTVTFSMSKKGHDLTIDQQLLVWDVVDMLESLGLPIYYDIKAYCIDYNGRKTFSGPWIQIEPWTPKKDTHRLLTEKQNLSQRIGLVSCHKRLKAGDKVLDLKPSAMGKGGSPL